MDALDGLNSDVWLPFMRAYSELDIDLFSTIHARDFVRVENRSRWIGGLDSYRQRTASSPPTSRSGSGPS